MFRVIFGEIRTCWPRTRHFRTSFELLLDAKPSRCTQIRFWETKTYSPQVTTDSDTVFREKSIGEGFKIVTVAVFEKILLFEKKFGSSLTAIFKPTRVVTKLLVKWKL